MWDITYRMNPSLHGMAWMCSCASTRIHLHLDMSIEYESCNLHLAPSTMNMNNLTYFQSHMDLKCKIPNLIGLPYWLGAQIITIGKGFRLKKAIW